MSTTTSIEPAASWWYPWQIRLALWRRNLAEFLGELTHHPIALVGGVIVILFILAAIFAPYITVHDPELGSLRNRLEPPMWAEGGSAEFPLGTDAQGRDLLTRIIYGARVSLAVGILTVAISVGVGASPIWPGSHAWLLWLPSGFLERKAPPRPVPGPTVASIPACPALPIC